MKEACLSIQNPGLSEEANEDTKEGRKLPEKAQEEVDSE